MIVRVWYKSPDFFGYPEQRESYREVYSEESAKNMIDRVMKHFKKMEYGYSVRVESIEEFYLIEQNGADVAAGVFTVTHRNNAMSIDAPVKMSSAAVKKTCMALYAKEEKELDAA